MVWSSRVEQRVSDHSSTLRLRVWGLGFRAYGLRGWVWGVYGQTIIYNIWGLSRNVKHNIYIYIYIYILSGDYQGTLFISNHSDLNFRLQGSPKAPAERDHRGLNSFRGPLLL